MPTISDQGYVVITSDGQGRPVVKISSELPVNGQPKYVFAEYVAPVAITVAPAVPMQTSQGSRWSTSPLSITCSDHAGVSIAPIPSSAILS